MASRILLSAFLFSTMMASGLARAEGKAALQPRVETKLKAGTERSLGVMEAWVPLRQQPDRVLYGDARFMMDNQDNAEGNLGVGYRQMTKGLFGREAVAGGHAWLDARRTELGSTFHQVTLGGELLARDWDLRANAYVPLTGAKTHATPNQGQATPYLSGSGILYDTQGRLIEEPQPGLDVEAGVRVPVFEADLDSVRVYVGGYHFDGDRTPDITGWRTRAVADVTPAVSLGVHFQSDDERGSQGFLEATFRFPFDNKKDFRTHGLRSRLDDSPERDVDIVVGSARIDSGIGKAVRSAADGTAQRVLHVDNTAAPGGDGTLERPFNQLKQAESALEANDVVYVHAGNGTADGQDAGFIIDEPGVSLIGSGADFIYDGGRFTADRSFSGVVLAEATVPPVIRNTEVNTTNFTGVGVYVTADRARVSGVAFDPTTTGNNVFAYNNSGQAWESFAVSDIQARSGAVQRGEGVRVHANNQGSMIRTVDISKINAAGNTRGVNVSVETGGAITTLNIDSINVANGGGAPNTGISVVASAGGAIGSASITNATIQNTLDAITISSQVGASNTTSIQNVLMENISVANTRSGILLRAQNGNHIGNVQVRNVTSRNNDPVLGTGSFQIFAVSNGTIDSVSIDRLTATNNRTSGFSIYADAASSLSSLTLTRSVITGNAAAAGSAGIILNDDTTGTFNVSIAGNNSIYANTTADVLLDLDNGTVNAQNNWWGQPGGPAGGRIVNEAACPSCGTADTSGALTFDPNL